MLLKGVLLALTAAAMHSSIDWIRKAAHAKLGLSSTALVTLCAILDAVIGGVGVGLMGGFSGARFLDFHMFVIVVCSSSSLLLATKVLYQLAISSSPLSLTVPYLALTPVFLVGTAFVLVGEQPTMIGLAGVAIVTLGGYLLSRVGADPTDATDLPQLSSDHEALASKDEDDEHGVKGLREQDVTTAYQPSNSLSGKATRRGGSASGALDKLHLAGPRSCWDRIAQLPKQQRLSGSAMMLCVAALWSVTASLDKLGVLYGSLWVYMATQRIIIGLACAVYLFHTSPDTFKLLRSHFWVLLAISVCEIASVIVFLEAIKYVLVSYVVAIKRTNVLLSVLMGGIVFKENVVRRLPYVVLMLCGMTCIVLDPKG